MTFRIRGDLFAKQTGDLFIEDAGQLFSLGPLPLRLDRLPTNHYEMAQRTEYRASLFLRLLRIHRSLELEELPTPPEKPTARSWSSVVDRQIKLPLRIVRALFKDEVGEGGVSFVDKGDGVVEMMSDATFADRIPKDD